MDSCSLYIDAHFWLLPIKRNFHQTWDIRHCRWWPCRCSAPRPSTASPSAGRPSCRRSWKPALQPAKSFFRNAFHRIKRTRYYSNLYDVTPIVLRICLKCLGLWDEHFSISNRNDWSICNCWKPSAYLPGRPRPYAACEWGLCQAGQAPPPPSKPWSPWSTSFLQRRTQHWFNAL